MKINLCYFKEVFVLFQGRDAVFLCYFKEELALPNIWKALWQRLYRQVIFYLTDIFIYLTNLFTDSRRLAKEKKTSWKRTRLVSSYTNHRESPLH